MKKIALISVPVAIVLILAGVFLFFRFRYLPMQQVLHVDFNKVDKVELRYDIQTKTITGEKNVREFLSLFNGVKLRKHEEIPNDVMAGYCFIADLYQNGKVKSSFEFGYNSVIAMNTPPGKSTIYLSTEYYNDALIRLIAQKYGLS